MKTQDIEYHADGQRLVGYLAVDDGKAGKRPGWKAPARATKHRRLSAGRWHWKPWPIFCPSCKSGGLPGRVWR